MGKKKATSLKKDTKALLEQQSDNTPQHAQRIDAATTPAAPLFTIDTKPAAAKPTNNKKVRAAAAVAASAASAGNKRRRADDEDEQEDAAAAEAGDAMDDVDAGTAAAAAAPALFENDSDDEPTGIVVRNRHQRSAHKPRPTELVNAKEAKRLQVAAKIKAEAEAAAASKPAVFDVWATDREADLVAGIKPVTDARGFRIGRMQQRAFRHHGEEKQKEHLVASTLKNKIHAGASFHPDEEAHQALLRKAFEKDEAERSELEAIRARFNVATPDAPAASAESAAAAAAEDDSWMDSNASAFGGKNAVTTSTKFSKTKRNQLARKAANVAKHAAMLESKALDKFVKRLPVLVAELKKEEKLAAKERARIEQAKELHPDHKPKLGRYEEEELFPDVALTEELPEGGSLRKLTPSAHVVKDQFARFQERHLIETRKKVKKHRGMKAKVYERYKDDPEPLPTLQQAAAASS